MNTPVRSNNRNAWRIFRWPLAIGVGSTVGLVSALIGDGPYDALSWLLLGGCVVMMLVAWQRKGGE